MFTLLETMPDGTLTAEYDDPKREAYAYCAQLVRQSRHYLAIYHEDGSVEVRSPGLAKMRFRPRTEAN